MMRVYFDSSALVPLLVREASSTHCAHLWSTADARVSSCLAQVEVAAALAQAQRMRRITAEQHRLALEHLRVLLDRLDLVQTDAALLDRAANLASEQGLRGYDAVHCASAEAVASDDLVAASGDHTLNEAWHRLGIATYPTA